jgi:DNA replication protein DnaC
MTFDTITNANGSLLRCAMLAKAIGEGERKRGLFMIGKPGRGKTHVMVASFRLGVERGLVVAWANAPAFVQRVQATYAKEATERRHEILRRMFDHQVVYLDDLGKERQSADVDGILYELVDGLYARRRTLVVSSNLPGEVFKNGERYDPALVSRFKQMTTRVHVAGEDRREDADYR